MLAQCGASSVFVPQYETCLAVAMGSSVALTPPPSSSLVLQGKIRMAVGTGDFCLSLTES